MEGAEDLNKARYYGAHAADKAVSNQEKKDSLVGLALSELDNLLSSKGPESMVKPLLVKFEVVRKVGEPRKVMSILQQVQKIYKDAERNTEFMILSKAAHITPNEADIIEKKLQNMEKEGVIIIHG